MGRGGRKSENVSVSKSARNFLFVLPVLLSAAVVLFVFTPRRSETAAPVSAGTSGDMLSALAVPVDPQEPPVKATPVYQIANPYHALSLESSSTPLRMVRPAEPARPAPTLEVASADTPATPTDPEEYQPRTRAFDASTDVTGRKKRRIGLPVDNL